MLRICCPDGESNTVSASSSLNSRPRPMSWVTRWRWTARNCCCATSFVSAANTLTPAITYGSASWADGRNSRRYVATASSNAFGAKWEANEYGSPSAAANLAPNSDEPSMYNGTYVPLPGVASTPGITDWSPKNPCNSWTSWGKLSAELISRRNARTVFWSLPGARPKPRSMRPGCNVSSVPNCSAIVSGAWLGSMMPPDPSRIVSVCAAMCPISTLVADDAIVDMLWCSAYQIRRYPHSSACLASVTLASKLSRGVAPFATCARSRMEMGTIQNTPS